MPYLTRADLSARWGISISTINKYARIAPELLPPSIKICGRYRYRLTDVIEFEAKQLNKTGVDDE